jgi:hypothetical protein
MPRYEYKLFDVDFSASFGTSNVPEDELNALGAEGWDVVATINSPERPSCPVWDA